jgi:hypothetical protein
MSQQISITELREQAMRSSRPIIADGHLITVVSGLEKRARYIGLQHPHRDKVDPEPADIVALWERDARHPGGEAYIAGDTPVEVACTERVAEKLRSYELLELLEIVEG